jgi:hypothetical protein
MPCLAMFERQVLRRSTPRTALGRGKLASHSIATAAPQCSGTIPLGYPRFATDPLHLMIHITEKRSPQELAGLLSLLEVDIKAPCREVRLSVCRSWKASGSTTNTFVY